MPYMEDGLSTVSRHNINIDQHTSTCVLAEVEAKQLGTPQPHILTL